MNIEKFKKKLEQKRIDEINQALVRQEALRPNRHDRKRMVAVEEPQIFRGKATTTKCLVSAAELKKMKAWE